MVWPLAKSYRHLTALPFALPVFRRRYHTPSPPRNIALASSQPGRTPSGRPGSWLSKRICASLTARCRVGCVCSRLLFLFKIGEFNGFRPHPESMDFGQLMSHIAITNYQFCAGLKDSQPPALPLPKKKDAIVKFLSD